MRPTTVTCTIDAPREQVFGYLADIANHAEFTDHFLRDLRLERLDSRGVGAAVSFRVASALGELPIVSPLGSLPGDAVITELEPPHRIVVEGQLGRRGRIKVREVFTLTLHHHDMTRVALTFSSEPATRSDRLREALGARPWLKRQWRVALRRMKAILEEGQPSARAVRVAPG